MKWINRVENSVANGEIALLEQFSLFPVIFSKDKMCWYVFYNAINWNTWNWPSDSLYLITIKLHIFVINYYQLLIGTLQVKCPFLCVVTQYILIYDLFYSSLGELCFDIVNILIIKWSLCIVCAYANAILEMHHAMLHHGQ